MIGETVGNFKIVSKLSIGGMGTVYKAEHTLIGKHAAVKILHPELSGSRDLVNRFFNEAKATTSIKHPGIVEVFDYGYMKSGDAYLTMEFLEGMSLAQRIETRGRMSEGEAAMLLRAVCSALGAAHAKGIVHRDLKPDNIFLTPDPDSAIGERPKVLDFGIAKLTDIGLAGTATKTGAVMGTPTYMSPEQCRGTGDVDARADLYSIGCIFYELVTGEPPFTKLGAGELIGAHLYVEPEPPTILDPDLQPDTVKLIMALLRKRPAERPQTAKELGQRLGELAQKLGWITASSPNGVTGPVLTDLSLRAHASATDIDRPALLGGPPVDQTTPYTPSPSLMTPGGSSAPSLASLARSLDGAPEHDTAAETPTTLSGAASQLGLEKRSRKGLGLAMVAAALLAGGAVAFLKLTGNREPVATKAPVVEQAPQHAAPPQNPAHVDPVSAAPVANVPAADTQVPAPMHEVVEPPKPEPPKPEPPKPEPPKQLDAVARDRKRQQDRRRAAAKVESKKPEPKKPASDNPVDPPKQPSLIETDI